MPIRTVVKGPAYEICAWVDKSGQCDLEDFFRELRATGHKDLAKIHWLLKRTAEHGIPKNKELSRDLEGEHAKGIFEFKANAVRVMWFFDENRIIVCTHGFLKKSQKTKKREIVQAIDGKRRYFDESEGKKRDG